MIGAYRRREPRAVAAHSQPVKRGAAIERTVLITKVGGAFWLISRLREGELLDDEEAVQLAIRSRRRLSTHRSLAEAVGALRHWLPEGE
jgi:hypothetical protein